MLRELSIQNFAIIDDLNIQFANGLTVLSGETGAGKSIIINAVNLLLGNRATSRMVRTGEDTAELAALFEIRPDSEIAEMMRNQGLDPEEGLVVRRLISRSDRHKVYINGRPATMGQLAGLTENLAGISGQHAHQGLLKEEQHLLILDQFGGLLPLREKVGRQYHRIMPLIEERTDLHKIKSRQQQHLELLRFQKQELEEAGLTPGEDEQLERERKILKNSAVLQSALHLVTESLYDGQGAVHEKLVECRKHLEKAMAIDPQLEGRTESLAGIVFGLEDVTEELRQYAQSIETDAGRLDQVEDRIAELNQLKKKYGGSIETALEQYEVICRELLDVDSLDERIEAVEEQLVQVYEKMVSLARELSRKRKQVATGFARKVEQELAALKMPDTRFHILLETQVPSGDPSPYLIDKDNLLFETGLDKARFLISPNVGEALKPLVDIASGGELSRVVLALKAILAVTDAVETVVFDEVDAGIGGGVAEVVGKKLVALSRTHQVICITHLPQIARFGDHHFRIEKITEKGRTRTRVKPLSRKERVEEIARMLGGVEITRKTRDHAREMLESCRTI